jgi:hypothetical protein
MITYRFGKKQFRRKTVSAKNRFGESHFGEKI